MNLKIVFVPLIAAIALAALACGPATPEPMTPEAVPSAAPSGDGADAAAPEQPK